MKRFCESLRDRASEIIDFKKKKIKLLTNEQQKSCENAKLCNICKDIFEDKDVKEKNIER